MRTAVLCSRAEYFIDQHHTSRQVPLGEWFVEKNQKEFLKEFLSSLTEV